MIYNRHIVGHSSVTLKSRYYTLLSSISRQMFSLRLFLSASSKNRKMFGRSMRVAIWHEKKGAGSRARVHELKDSLWALGESSAHGKWTLRVLSLSSPPAVYRPRVASRLRISARFFPRFSFSRSSFILDERQSSKRVKETCTLST